MLFAKHIFTVFGRRSKCFPEPDEAYIIRLSENHGSNHLAAPSEYTSERALKSEESYNDNTIERPTLIHGERHSLRDVAENIAWWEQELSTCSKR